MVDWIVNYLPANLLRWSSTWGPTFRIDNEDLECRRPS